MLHYSLFSQVVDYLFKCNAIRKYLHIFNTMLYRVFSLASIVFVNISFVLPNTNTVITTAPRLYVKVLLLRAVAPGIFRIRIMDFVSYGDAIP